MAGSAQQFWNQELETLPWREVEAWQTRQIALMLASLPERSTMYRQMLARASSPLQFAAFADLQSLPFTMKDDLREAQSQATDDQPFGTNQSVPTREIVQVLSSSGTTGQPLNYALTNADVEMFTDAIANAWFTAGVRSDDIVAHLVGLPMVAGGLPYADAFRRIGATLCWLGGFPTERILREMRRLRVSTVLATTSFGLYLSEHWEASGAQSGIDSKLRRLIGGGEPGLNQPEIRERIMRGLSISQVRDAMGLGDVISALWSECEQGNGMHFNAQRYVAVELIDPQTGAAQSWREGASGELVYTGFARQATPVLRYRSRDHAQVLAVGCACGRTSPRISCIGRTDDMLIYKGMNVFPTSIRDLIAAKFAGQVEPMLRIWKERAAQVRFDDPIQVDVEASRDTANHQFDRLASAIEHEVRTQLQVRVQITVLPHGTLPRGVYKTPLLAIRPSSGAAP